MRLSACHPDLGWKAGHQYANRDRGGDAAPMMPVVTPLTLTLNGEWRLLHGAEDAEVTVEEGKTKVTLRCADAKGVEFEMEAVKS